MPDCLQCGQPVVAPETLCDDCRQQRSFAEHAEDSATDDSQKQFLITNILLAINVAVFVLMVIKRVPINSPTSDQVVQWGGNYGPLTLGGQPWRLLTNVFLHIGIVHLFANMWALVILGRLAESLYGKWTFLGSYLIAGIAGSLASLLWNPMGVSAGASGALFGVAGALIATLYAGKLPVPKHAVRPVLISLVVWAAFDLAYGFWKTGLDNAAHIGGFLTGLFLGFALGHHLGHTRHAHVVRGRTLAIAVVLLAGLGFITWGRDGYVAQAERARILLAGNKNDDAIKLLLPLAQRRPNEPYVHLLLGSAYYRKQDYASAEREFKRITEISPRNTGAWNSLADLYVAQQRWADAAAAFTRAAQIGNDNGIGWYRAGLMYRQLDRPQDAVNAFEKTVAKNPYFFDAWYNLGTAYLNVKQPAKAVEALQKAVTLQPSSADAHLWLGNALMAAGQNQQAQVEFLKAFQIRALQQRAIQEAQKRAAQQQPQRNSQQK